MFVFERVSRTLANTRVESTPGCLFAFHDTMFHFDTKDYLTVNVLEVELGHR